METYDTRWDELENLRNEMGSFFGRAFGYGRQQHPLLAGHSGRGLVNYRRPMMDIYETDKEVVAMLEIPGVEKKDIHVHTISGGIEVKVETKKEATHKDEYHIEKRGFYQYFTVPETADIGKLAAEYKNGVLALKIPKKEGKGHEVKVD